MPCKEPDLQTQIKKNLANRIEELEKEIRGLEERNGELEAELGAPYCSKKEAAFHKALGFKS